VKRGGGVEGGPAVHLLMHDSAAVQRAQALELLKQRTCSSMLNVQSDDGESFGARVFSLETAQ
jgi:hypothetical protein